MEWVLVCEEPIWIRQEAPLVYKRKGFTLIELLVVVSIITLLVSILVPALSKAKAQTKAATCLSNLHQWGIIIKMYTQDNNGRFMRTQGYERYASLSNPDLKVYYIFKRWLLHARSPAGVAPNLLLSGCCHRIRKLSTCPVNGTYENAATCSKLTAYNQNHFQKWGIVRINSLHICND